MSKTLSLILVLILVISTLFGCKKRYLHIDEPTTKASQTSEETSSDITQLETTDDQSSTEETTSEETSEGPTTDTITVDTLPEIDGSEVVESAKDMSDSELLDWISNPDNMFFD